VIDGWGRKKNWLIPQTFLRETAGEARPEEAEVGGEILDGMPEKYQRGGRTKGY